MGLADEINEEEEEIVSEDDVEKLHEYLRHCRRLCTYSIMLDICLEWDAVRCAHYIIEGKLPLGYPNLSRKYDLYDPTLPLFHQVFSLMCEPDVFRTLIDHCKAASQVNQTHADLLPIHWLIEKLAPLSDWSPEKPLSELIGSLFLPQFRTLLECARVLAQHTHSLHQVAVGYILNGEILHLAALLLVASFTSGDFETIKSNTSSISSQAIRDQSVTPATDSAAAALLYIFENHGDKLSSMFINEHEPAEVTIEVATIIQHDDELKHIYSTSNLVEMRSTCETRLGTEIDETSGSSALSQTSRKSPFPTVKSVRERFLQMFVRESF